MNEDYVGIGSNAIDLSTLIAGFIGSQVLCGCMCDHFLSSCIMFRPCVSVGVSDSPGVVSGFIVVTFCVEGEPADHGSDLVVVILEVFPSLDVTEIGGQGVAAASYYEIQQIWPTDNPHKSSSTEVSRRGELKHAGSGYSSDQKNGGDECLTVHWALSYFQSIEVLAEFRISVRHIAFGIGWWRLLRIFWFCIRILVYLVGGVASIIDKWFLHQIQYINNLADLFLVGTNLDI